jgi:hypothetical protein
MDMRFGTWNVRSMYRAGSLRAVAEEITKYRFFCGVGLTPPLGPFFRSPRFRFLRSLCSSPLGPYKSQHCGHTLAYCEFPG